MDILKKRLRDTREDKDLKQKDIADILDITYQQYQLYESGKRKIPVDKFKELCDYYNISADYFLGFTKEQKKIR